MVLVGAIEESPAVAAVHDMHPSELPRGRWNAYSLSAIVGCAGRWPAVVTVPGSRGTANRRGDLGWRNRGTQSSDCSMRALLTRPAKCPSRRCPLDHCNREARFRARGREKETLCRFVKAVRPLLDVPDDG